MSINLRLKVRASIPAMRQHSIYLAQAYPFPNICRHKFDYFLNEEENSQNIVEIAVTKEGDDHGCGKFGNRCLRIAFTVEH
jgi:hypothetical protein